MPAQLVHCSLLSVHSKKQRKAVNRELSTVNHRGFSLVEILLALALIGVAITIFFATIGSFFWTKGGKDQHLAARIAVKKMEEIRNTAFSALPSSGPFSDTDLSKLPQGSGNLTVADWGGSSSIKAVTVTVTWQQAAGTKEVRLDTLITRGGIGQ